MPRTTATLLCILVSGCFSDPYYIDETLTPVSDNVSEPGVGSPDFDASTTATDSDTKATDGSNLPQRDTTLPAGPGPAVSETDTPPASTQGSDGEDTITEGTDPEPDANSEQQGVLVDGTCWLMCPTNTATDGNFDGWNRLDGRTCVVAGAHSGFANAPRCTYVDTEAGLLVDDACYAPCPPVDDPDGDGWGSMDGSDCVVPSSPVAEGATPCPHPG